jgi:antitoxin component HigA of HigAB toxin-antitoxin module
MEKAITTSAECAEALNRIDGLMEKDLYQESEDFHELEVLTGLVDAYETKRYPIDLTDDIEE